MEHYAFDGLDVLAEVVALHEQRGLRAAIEFMEASVESVENGFGGAREGGPMDSRMARTASGS